MSAIHELDGPVRIDPGKGGDGASFAFVNTSPWPICDLNVTTWDDDFLCTAPVIKPKDGFKISTFEPIQLPGGRVGVSNERPIDGQGWNRTSADTETTETKVNFEPEFCIQPGSGFVLNLKFTKDLQGNEGVEISPSRLYDGEHYAIGGDIKKRPDPVSWASVVDAIGKAGSLVPPVR